ncbi:lipopolysaccharide biosynthesis protein [Mycobacterium sp. NPDC003323]
MDSGTRRNFAAYYANFIVVAAAGFIVNPILLGALGPVMFGIWKSLQRYLDFATVADGRASQALKWIVASRRDLSDQELRRDVGAAVIIWFRWLPVALTLAVGVTIAMPVLIKDIPPDAKQLAYSVAAILAANTLLAGVLTIPDSVLVGVNQGYRSMIVNTATVIATNTAMVAAAMMGYPLWSLAAFVLLGAVFNFVINRQIVKRAVPWWGLARPERSDLRRVFSYSTWTLGWVAVDKLFVASELIIISVMIGVTGVTQYTFTTYVMQFVTSIALITASGFMPTLGSQLARSDLDAAAERSRSVRHLVLGVAVIGSSAVLALNGAFVDWWVGPAQYMGTVLNALLVICGLQLASIRVDGQILDVTMRIAPKVLFGLGVSIGGILVGCLVYFTTNSLVLALAAVILVRSVCNLAFPCLVARSVKGSALPWWPKLLAISLLLVSFGIGPVIQAQAAPIAVPLAVGWTILAGAAAWFGLIPRATVRALLARGASR